MSRLLRSSTRAALRTGSSLVPAPPQPWRTVLSCLAFAALFTVLVERLHHLQVEEGGRFSVLGEQQRERRWRIEAPRGTIVDATGVPLAQTTTVWHCYADPDYMNDKLRATVALAPILDLTRDQLRKHFEATSNGRCIARDLREEQAEAIRELELAGIYVRRTFKRSYPQDQLAAHVLGFVLDSGQGGLGLEQRFDNLLSGQAGHELVHVDAHGRPIIVGEDQRLPARPGARIYCTIDSVLQGELEAAIGEAVERHQPVGACGIVVRPSTGHVLAMASWPHFDPNDFGEADPQAFRNNVLNFVYESGSTMKPLVAGAAVADGVVRWDSRVFCENGRWTYRGRTITDHSLKHGGHQYLSVVDGVAKSDNILMAKLGIELGPARLYDWVRRFGFGRPTGIELPGEDLGLVLPRERWNRRDSCMSVPMGHEMAVTPLQMAMAHAAIANEGLWLPPRVLRRIVGVDENGHERELSLPPAPEPRRLFDPADADAIEYAMRQTMEVGTGRRSQLDGWSSAGKTGTTEKLVETQVGGRTVRRYSDEHHIGSFVSWAPAERSQPAELLCLVVIDDPQQNGHYGSQTAAPVVQRVLQFGMERYFSSPYPDQP